MPKVVAEKKDWITLGFDLFAKQGEAGIIVDKMVNVLKCNRSSFYWHFNSKKEFIQMIIEYWTDFDTEQVIAMTEKSGSPKTKFKKLVEVAFKQDPQIDFVFHIKRYALKHKNIQGIIDEIDQRRISYTASLLMEMGLTEEEATLKAGIFYNYLIGYHEMIRYKKQEKDYVKRVYQELSQFIPL